VSSDEDNRENASTPEEFRRIYIISLLALLLFGLSMLVEGPVTLLALLLTSAGLLCLVFIIVASRIHLKQNRSSSRKADTQ
jgi:hypothetical protein